MSVIPYITPLFQWLKLKARGDKSIWGCVIILFIFSILVVYSTSGFLKDVNPKRFGHYLTKQLIFISVGILIVYLGHILKYLIYGRFALIAFLASIVLLLYTLLFGVNINDGTRWVRIPGINLTFQSSDFAKVALVLFLSRFLAKNQERIGNFSRSFLPMLLSILCVALLIAPSNLSTAIIVTTTGFVLLFIGRAKIKHLLLSVLIVFGLPLGSLIGISEIYYDKSTNESKPLPEYLQISRVPVWIKRVQTYLHHRQGETHMNFQNQQANIAIVRGGLFGVGPGNSTQKYFLPLAYSDFIYAIIVEEYGIVTGIFILGIYLFFLYRCILIFRRCPHGFGGLLCIGLSLIFVFQALVSILVNVDLAPTTGIGLPLISMGGSSYVFNCLSIGIILSIARNIEELEGEGKRKKQNLGAQNAKKYG